MASFPERIKASIERMNQRERLMVFGLAGTVVALIFLFCVYLVYDGLETRRTKNEEITQILKDLQRHRNRLMAGKTEDARLDVKLGREPPALQGHLDKLAKRMEVQIKDYSPGKPKTLGKRKDVIAKSMVISIYDIEIGKLGKFLNGIEQGGFMIMTTRLRVKPRPNEHQRLDVTKLQVTTYERKGTKRAKSAMGASSASMASGPRRGRPGMAAMPAPSQPAMPGSMKPLEPMKGIAPKKPVVTPMRPAPVAPKKASPTAPSKDRKTK